MVEGRRFTLYTDHQSLVPALSKKTEPHTARQTYQLSGIAEYTTDIRYIEGKANVVADALSRPNETEEHVFLIAMVDAGITTQLGPGHKVHLTKTITTPSSSIKKPIPYEKLEDLNQSINSIVSLGIDFEEMSRNQPLDPDFTRV